MNVTPVKQEIINSVRKDIEATTDYFDIYYKFCSVEDYYLHVVQLNKFCRAFTDIFPIFNNIIADLDKSNPNFEEYLLEYKAYIKEITTQLKNDIIRQLVDIHSKVLLQFDDSDNLTPKSQGNHIPDGIFHCNNDMKYHHSQNILNFLDDLLPNVLVKYGIRKECNELHVTKDVKYINENAFRDFDIKTLVIEDRSSPLIICQGAFSMWKQHPSTLQIRISDYNNIKFETDSSNPNKTFDNRTIPTSLYEYIITTYPNTYYHIISKKD
jgi:hypothetical protein